MYEITLSYTCVYKPLINLLKMVPTKRKTSEEMYPYLTKYKIFIHSFILHRVLVLVLQTQRPKHPKPKTQNLLYLAISLSFPLVPLYFPLDKIKYTYIHYILTYIHIISHLDIWLWLSCHPSLVIISLLVTTNFVSNQRVVVKSPSPVFIQISSR